MNTRKRWLALGCLSFLLLASIRTYAGGPLLIRSPGVPYLWPNGGLNIPFNPDQGGLGPLPNAAAVAQTTRRLRRLGSDPVGVGDSHQRGLCSRLTLTRRTSPPFLFPEAPDGLSAIVYDEDGAIFNLLFGAGGAGVLGFAGPEWIDETTGAIIEGVLLPEWRSLDGAWRIHPS